MIFFSYFANNPAWISSSQTIWRLSLIHIYNKALNYDAALALIKKDERILLASLTPEKVLAFLDVCPTEIQKNRPLALLVLMRRMFTWHQIPKMMELKQLLTRCV